MRIITLWEPWATIMAIGAKKIETRHWRPADYECGIVAIHAAKGGLSKAELKSVCGEPFFLEVLEQSPLRKAIDRRPDFYFGHIIAVGLMVEALPTESVGCLPGVFDDYPELDTPQERAFGDYSEGRYGLVFKDVFRLQQPIPWTSRQGKLLNLDNDTQLLIEDQLYDAARTVGLPKGLQVYA